MYDNVLIGVKGDSDDRRAIALANRLASADTHITLVHVSTVSVLGSEREGLELEINSPGELARQFAGQLELAGDRACLIREHATSVGAGLQAAAKRVDADLLVLGSTAHHGLDRLLEGDDVGAALARTRCAVAIADVGPSRGRRPIARIGVAYDGSAASVVAAEHARALADALDARLTLLYVAEPHIYATGFGMVAYPIEDPESVMAAARTQMGTVCGEQVKVVYGDRGIELTEFSEKVDLLVCGSQRPGMLHRLAFGSTALSLSRSASCPLIIAPVPRTISADESSNPTGETEAASARS